MLCFAVERPLHLPAEIAPVIGTWGVRSNMKWQTPKPESPGKKPTHLHLEVYTHDQQAFSAFLANRPDEAREEWGMDSRKVFQYEEWSVLQVFY